LSIVSLDTDSLLFFPNNSLLSAAGQLVTWEIGKLHGREFPIFVSFLTIAQLDHEIGEKEMRIHINVVSVFGLLQN
jgi:hypothetical protein